MKKAAMSVLCICAVATFAYGGLLDPVSMIFEIPQFAKLPALKAAGKADDLASLQRDVRGDFVQQLKGLVGPATRRQDHAAARRAISLIYLLGAMRVGRAAPAMVEGIALAPHWHGLLRDALPPPFIIEGGYPAVPALVRVGMPSVRAILKVLPTERSALRRKLMVQVMVGVEGRAVARFRLRRLIAKATTAAAKTDLEAALRDVPPQPHAGQK